MSSSHNSTMVALIFLFAMTVSSWTPSSRARPRIPALLSRSMLADGEAAGQGSEAAVVYPFLELALPPDHVVVVDSMDTLSQMQAILFAPSPSSSSSSSTSIPIVGVDCEWVPENYEYKSKSKGKKSSETNEEESGDNEGVPLPVVDSSDDTPEGEERAPKKPRILRTSTVSTLQLATRDAAFIVDMLALCRQPGAGLGYTQVLAQSPTAPALTPTEALLDTIFQQLFATDSVVKLGFGPAADFKRLYWSYPWLPSLKVVTAAVDVQLLAKRVHPQVKKEMLCGLSKLCIRQFGEAVDKSQQCSPWGSRPLTPEQVTYAATDAWALTRLFDSLVGALEARGAGAEGLNAEVRSATRVYNLNLPSPLERALVVREEEVEEEEVLPEGAEAGSEACAGLDAGSKPPVLVLKLSTVVMKESMVPKKWVPPGRRI